MKKAPGARKRERSYYDMAIKMIDQNTKLRDQFIGTLMLLAYDGCISEGRARELAGIDVYEWRKELARVLRKPPARPLRRLGRGM